MFTQSDIPAIAEASLRLRDRVLYKAIDIRQIVSEQLGDSDKDRVELDEKCSEIELKIKEQNERWNTQDPQKLSRILLDRTERAPYKPMTESKGPLNQIRIRTSENKAEDLGSVSQVVNAIQPFKVLRAYHCPEDGEARDFLLKIIKEK